MYLFIKTVCVGTARDRSNDGRPSTGDVVRCYRCLQIERRERKNDWSIDEHQSIRTAMNIRLRWPYAIESNRTRQSSETFGEFI
jgi:hypothetical protein